ncbi:MAG: methylated-DNA--[protein]-cysteine S-methyltransferase [Gemmatimonadetes bacterium]|nr:methylated-DNA--[protein]-cysteine S-methyltransferase [Gemmatimonadota bacterium]MYA44295.1 methylated-DNA--[protein]-cysteine S-methyltransferase [Gemmatimonadota bacterium]MYE93124.1 methylated-DNA--[protein]-cysteine S-methyltransferase [Gemmatimonadota bacterium]MYJ09177.1 methylated-DNA--[protein]-cysteine S-methyltransferase [Gemmatimonadota bacterium]
MGSRSAPRSTVRLDTPLGPMTAGATDEGVCLLEFAEGEATADGNATPGEPLRDGLGGRHLKALETQLAEYFAGARRDFDLPLALAGTDFQHRVWRQLQRVPFGETITYDELARRAGSPGASRAAGQANGSNPVAIVVPCHRVIRASGETGGYAGGPDRKRRLLELEAPSAQGSLFSPP